MKKKSHELNVDIIGQQGETLTKEDQLAISSFLRKLKATREKANKRGYSKKVTTLIAE